MNLEQFVNRVRFIFADTRDSNLILREPLIARPQNVIDGVNRMFYLLNRRIVVGSLRIYNSNNEEVPVIDYTLAPMTGLVMFIPGKAPTEPLFADYAWLKLSDAELQNALELAASSGNFSLAEIPDVYLDYAVKYAASYCFSAAAARAADYYTLSAAGKQVSKSELFNHYTKMSEQMLNEAKAARTDARQDRGDRDVPAAVGVDSLWSDPYFPQDGGL